MERCAEGVRNPDDALKRKLLLFLKKKKQKDFLPFSGPGTAGVPEGSSHALGSRHQCIAGAGPPSLMLRKLKASGTQAIEIRVRAQKAST